MASKRGGGPGTYDQNGVRCTMDAPFAKGMNSKPSNKMKGPFDGGVSGIPTKVYDDLGGKAPGPSQVAPSQQGGKRTGTKEYPYGGKMSDGRSNR